MRQCDCQNFSLIQGQLPLDCSTENLAVDSTRKGSPEEVSVPSVHQASQRATATKIRVLGLGLLLSSSFSVVEWAAGWWSHSLTLVTDAGHMLSDCLALGLALIATWLAQLAVTQKPWLGVQRAETLAALANGVGLLVLAIWVVWEATNRFQHQHPAVVSEVMLVTAIIGLGVNLIAASVLHDHSHHDLNIRGAFLHVLADTASSVGVLIAAGLIWAFHWNWADPVISLFIACLIGCGAFPLIRASIKTLRNPTLNPKNQALEQLQNSQ